jgi:hypothetical protein
LPFYHGIFSACCYFSTVSHRRGIASGATPLVDLPLSIYNRKTDEKRAK